MPDIDFAFLADAAETVPGQKFHVLGGGVARIGGRRFPLRHPHLALVVGLQVTSPETDREHEIRFVLLDPDGGEVAGATGSLVARSQQDARDAVLAEVQQHKEFRRPDQLVQKIFTQPITRIRHLTGDHTYAINTARAYLDGLAELQVLEKQTIQGQYYYLNRELYTILAD